MRIPVTIERPITLESIGAAAAQLPPGPLAILAAPEDVEAIKAAWTNSLHVECRWDDPPEVLSAAAAQMDRMFALGPIVARLNGCRVVPDRSATESVIGIDVHRLGVA